MVSLLFRLNTRFEFSELCSTLSDDSSIYKSPSASASAGSGPASVADSSQAVKSTVDLHPRSSSEVFRKFSSEPALVGSRHSSRCGFRERVRADCMADEPIDCPQHHNTFSDSPTENCPSSHVFHDTKKRLCHQHSRCHARHNSRLKSHVAKFRRPLSDCGAQENSSSPMSEAAAAASTPPTPRLSEDEMRSVCVDVVLAR